MKRISTLVLAAGLALQACRAAEPAAPHGQSRIAVVAIGDVPAKLASNACEWAARNLALRIDLLPPQQLKGKSLDDIAAQAAAAAGPGRAHVVAIAMPPEGFTSHGMRTADKRAAVINLRPMQADQPGETPLGRRIERQAIRAVALLIDLETCPNPQCALTRYADLKELDQTGRNLCPPCLQKFQRNAASARLDMDKNSPFYIGN